MHTDISRDSHDPKKNFTRVLMQQGRLFVDADWNEQSAIVLNYMRTLAADIIGWHGGPGVTKETNVPKEGAFVVTLDTSSPTNVKVTGGRYYVDGILIDWPVVVNPYDAVDVNRASDLKNRIVMVDAYERHVATASDSSILDPALIGLDTCTRTHLYVRFKVVFSDLDGTQGKEVPTTEETFRKIKIKKNASDDDTSDTELDSRPLRSTSLPQLIALTKLDSSDQEDCVEESHAGYTGLENQLYRVEVHHTGIDGMTFWDGEALDPKTKDTRGAFTLKWSRDNGSVVYAATAGSGTATLKNKWRDETRAIRKGDLVELIPSLSDSGTIVSVKSVQEDNGAITIGFAQPDAEAFKQDDPIIIRRWDHRNRKKFPVASNGGFLVTEKFDENKTGTGDSIDIPLEDGVFVRLSLGKRPDVCKLQAGDYWLIPARAATSDIIWRRTPGETGPESYLPEPARFTEHHYAPIALIKADKSIVDLRRKITPVTGE